MKKVICNISVVALCMGIGIASSDAQQLSRSTKSVQLNEQIPDRNTCWVDENGYAIDEPPAGQLATFVAEGTEAGSSYCGPDGWSHAVGGPAPFPPRGSIPPRADHKPLIPGEPIEGEFVPGARDQSEFNQFMEEASAAARQREERRRQREGVD